MSISKITVTLTPSEFEVLRRALAQHVSNQAWIAKDKDTDIRLRSKAGAEHTLACQLRDRMFV